MEARVPDEPAFDRLVLVRRVVVYTTTVFDATNFCTTSATPTACQVLRQCDGSATELSPRS
jgi:hypothetical protein